MLKWYQNLVLVEVVSTKLAAKRLEFVRMNLPNGGFVTLCAIVKNNLDAWTSEEGRDAVNRKVAELLAAFRTESAEASPPPQLDEMYRRKLGFAILNAGGTTIFKTLFS